MGIDTSPTLRAIRNGRRAPITPEAKQAIRELVQLAGEYDGSRAGRLTHGGVGTDPISLITWASDRDPDGDVGNAIYNRLWRFNESERSSRLGWVVVTRALIRREADLAARAARAEANDPLFALTLPVPA